MSFGGRRKVGLKARATRAALYLNAREPITYFPAEAVRKRFWKETAELVCFVGTYMQKTNPSSPLLHEITSTAEQKQDKQQNTSKEIPSANCESRSKIFALQEPDSIGIAEELFALLIETVIKYDAIVLCKVEIVHSSRKHSRGFWGSGGARASQARGRGDDDIFHTSHHG